MLVVLSLLTALVVGGLLVLVANPIAGAAAAVLIVAAGIAAQRTSGAPRTLIGLTLLIAMIAGTGFGAATALDLLDAVTTTTGAVEAADAAMLDSAEDKIEDLADDSAFRLELTEAELQAVIQDGIAAGDDLPIRRVDLDLRGPTSASVPAGDIAFTTTFKSSGIQASGTALVTTTADGVGLELGTLDFGPVTVPALGAEAVQSVVGAVTDLNAALAAQQTVVQSIEITDDVLVIVGVRAGRPLTGGQLLAAIRGQAEAATQAVVPRPRSSARGRSTP